MAQQPAPRARIGSLARARPTDEHHTTTTFELFFDLVYVFAVTQVTAFMAHGHTPAGVLQGMLLLGWLWWTWSAYTWLGNQARADEGMLRAGMVVAMVATFVIALTIPEAWHDAPGGLPGPVVLVCAYAVVRAVHLVVYSAVAGGDARLRRQVAVSWVPMLAGVALLLAAVHLGGHWQTVLFAIALFVDWGLTYLTSRGVRGWRVHSASHWTERHGLFVMLSIGESVVAVGVGASGQPVGVALLAAAALGVAAAVCLWWLYFDTVAGAAERRVAETRDEARVALAIDAYTYGHFPIVAGVVLAALGLEGVLAHAGDSSGLGAFYASALCGGFAVYLAGHLWFAHRVHGALSTLRLAAAAGLLVALPVAAVLPPLGSLGLAVVVLVALVALESGRYGVPRR